MSSNNDNNLTHETAIFGLWLNWVIAGGALCIPSLLSVYIPAAIIPFICLALTVGLIFYDRHSIRSSAAVCPQVLTIAGRSLFYTAVIMIVISLIYKKGLIDYFYDPETLNPAIPYVTLLILAPVVLISCLWAHFRGKNYSACQRCEVMLGPASERGFLGKIFTQESRYQRIFLTIIAIGLTLISWGYYLIYYVNVNINIPDRFFFGWVPAILYFISIFYLAARCFSLWAYYYQDVEGSQRRHGASTTLRILIMSGENIFLTRDMTHLSDRPDAHLADTPLSLTMRHREDINLEKARNHCSEMTGLQPDEFSMRFLYESTEASGDRNTFHYVAVPNAPEMMNESEVDGEWYNMAQLERLLHNRELTPMLAAEIHRIYTVVMAWKTYDSEGRRLYRVKHYRPVMRLSGIIDWDVDFNSKLWLRVARINQDRSMWRLRKLWRRIYHSKDDD